MIDAYEHRMMTEDQRRFAAMTEKVARLFPKAKIDFSHSPSERLLYATVHAGDASCRLQVDYYFQIENWPRVSPFYRKYVEGELIRQLGQQALMKVWAQPVSDNS